METQAALTFVIWAAILVVQNMSFTAVSRARNSGNDWYHAAWSVMSNGVWFAAFIFTFDYLTQIQQTKSVLLVALVGGVYVAATVFGSVFGGRLVKKYFERGDRRVGHYNDNEVWKIATTEAIEKIAALQMRHHNDIRVIATLVKLNMARMAAESDLAINGTVDSMEVEP